MEIIGIDHLVLTVKNIEKTVEFYTSVLGMKIEFFGNGRVALKFGNQKINLHELGHEFEPKAEAPTSGSADVCFLIQSDIEEAIKFVAAQGIHIIEGPIERTGATGTLLSFYFRDPDYNLIELSSFKKG